MIIFCYGINSVYAQGNHMQYGKVLVDVSVVWQSREGVRAYLVSGKDTLQADYVSSDNFYWNKVPVGIATCQAYADGFITVSDTVLVKPGTLVKKRFYLTDKVLELKTVMIKGHIPAVVYKGDTIRFNPKGVQILEGDMARQILEQMPGVKIGENSVSVAGKDVEKTYVDGKPIFGDNPMTAIDHLPALDVLHIYAYDEYTHKEQKEKYRKGKKRRVLNIETKSKLINSTEASLITNAGSNLQKEEGLKHDFRYGAGGVFNFFSEEFLLSVNLLHNNLNRNTNQALYYQSTREPQRFYGENSYSGFSLSKRWGKEPGFYRNLKASYHFSRQSIEQHSEFEQNYFPTSSFNERIYSSTMRSNDEKRKHHMELTYDLADKKWGNLIFKHLLTGGNSSTWSNQWTNNRTDGVESGGILRNNKHGTDFYLKETLNWNKYFGLWNVALAMGYSNQNLNNNEQRLDSLQTELQTFSRSLLNIPEKDRKNSWEGMATITRSLHKNKMDQIGLMYSFETGTDRYRQEGWDVSDPNQPIEDELNTYHYKDRTTIHKVALNSNFTLAGLDWWVNAGWQHSALRLSKKDGMTSYSRLFNAPDLSVSFSFGKNPQVDNWSLHYELIPNLPSVAVLRPEINNANPYFLNTGNPDLKQGLLHSIILRYSHNFNQIGNSLSSTFFLRLEKNAVCPMTTYFQSDTYLKTWDYTAKAGTTLNSYANSNGHWTLDWQNFWTIPLITLKSTLNFTVLFNYSEDPYFYNSKRDKNKNGILGGGVAFSFGGIRHIRASISEGTNYHISRNSFSQLDNRVFSQSQRITLSWKPVLKYFFINLAYGFNFQKNNATHDFNRTHLLNTYVGCKLFKNRAELSFTAYDLLNSYNPNRIMVKTNYVNSVKRDNFGRYFTFNFSWNFRKIKSNRMDISRGITNY